MSFSTLTTDLPSSITQVPSILLEIIEQAILTELTPHSAASVVSVAAKTLKQCANFHVLQVWLYLFLEDQTQERECEITRPARELCSLFMDLYILLHRPDIYLDETMVHHSVARLMLEGIEMMFARDHHHHHNHIHYNFRLADVAFREEEFFRLCCEAEGHMYVPMNHGNDNDNNKPWPTHAELTKKRLIAYKEIPAAHRLCITTQAGPMARRLLCVQA